MIDRAPLEIELLVTADQRRVTVDDHAEFRARLAADLEPRTNPAQELDELIEELREARKEEIV
jgi:hypothetical protein